MMPGIHDPEIFGVTESTITIAFRLEGDDRCEVRIDGRVRTTVESPGVHACRIDDLAPGREYRVSLRSARGHEAPHDGYFPDRALQVKFELRFSTESRRKRHRPHRIVGGVSSVDSCCF